MHPSFRFMGSDGNKQAGGWVTPGCSGNRNLQLGIPVQVVIKTGKITLMNYLVKPLFDRKAISGRER
jgi:hypothetical protein